MYHKFYILILVHHDSFNLTRIYRGKDSAGQTNLIVGASHAHFLLLLLDCSPANQFLVNKTDVENYAPCLKENLFFFKVYSSLKKGVKPLQEIN